ncbi:GTP binding protein 1 [Phyllostomus discolor]|uniref:GTP binding protein 1 n=1 Tax=Phyllostomus discolor TaxID=89673 RepID=A0A834AQP2_9CHIR|nr:GTP binding protein 1 [Phyllostomus discolor]
MRIRAVMSRRSHLWGWCSPTPHLQVLARRRRKGSPRMVLWDRAPGPVLLEAAVTERALAPALSLCARSAAASTCLPCPDSSFRVGAGGQQRWHRGHDQGAPGLGAGTQRACFRGGHQDRHVSCEHPARNTEAAAAPAEVAGLPEDPRAGAEQGRRDRHGLQLQLREISNVTGENLDLLKMFLNLLSPRTSYREEEPAEFQIDDTYSVPGVGTVVSGTTLRGLIKLNDTLLLGPDPLGNFLPIAVKSIHRKRMPVKEVRGGQTASFALKKIKRSSIRKGMVMVSPRLNPQASWEFEAEILVLHHPTTISPRYQAMVHCGSIRQTATILSMDKDCLRTGDKATVHFRFIKTPEYLHIDQRLVFREGRTKAVGTITKLLQTTNNSPMNSKPQQIKMQSTKKGPLSKREDGPSGGPALGVPPPGDEACSLGASQSALSSSLQPTSKPSSGGRRRGGQRHKVKSQGACATPASGC